MRKMLLVGGLAIIMATGFVLSGCLIDPPDYPNKVANILKLKPANLERLPDGVMYEGWLVNGEIGVDDLWEAEPKSEWKSFGRFNWDPYNYQPLDANGNIIENRFDAGVDVMSYDRIFITIEMDGLPAGHAIVILQGAVDLMNSDADLEHPISTAEIDDFNPEPTYWIYSQSDGEWWDTLTGDKGIWFGSLDTSLRTVFDTLCYDDFDSAWLSCGEDVEPDTLYPCTVSVETLYDTTYDPLAVDTTITAIIDTVLNIFDCLEGTVVDTFLFHDTVYTIEYGDTAQIPSLEKVPNAVDGWKFEAWIIFTQESGYAPISMGRFSRIDEADDDSSYSDILRYDWNFGFPGEDFLFNVPDVGNPNPGELNVVDNMNVEKLFITVEPDPDFDYDNPFKQLIMLSARIPKPELFYGAFKGQREYGFVVRDLGYEINEGHRWPAMHIDFERDMVVD